MYYRLFWNLLVPRKILKRLLEELRCLLKEKTGEAEKQKEASDNIRDLLRELTDTVKKISDAGHRTVIIIDALNKVDEVGQTTKVNDVWWQNTLLYDDAE